MLDACRRERANLRPVNRGDDDTDDEVTTHRLRWAIRPGTLLGLRRFVSNSPNSVYSQIRPVASRAELGRAGT
jgi:hypothetical protein